MAIIEKKRSRILDSYAWFLRIKGQIQRYGLKILTYELDILFKKIEIKDNFSSYDPKKWNGRNFQRSWMNDQSFKYDVFW